MMHSMLTV
jgi:hypothetical protein